MKWWCLEEWERGGRSRWGKSEAKKEKQGQPKIKT